MPTIKRLMDVGIVGMVVLDLALTVLFFARRHHPPAQAAASPPAVAASAGTGRDTGTTRVSDVPYVLTSSTDAFLATSDGRTPVTVETKDVSAATFLLLRSGDITSEVFMCYPGARPSTMSAGEAFHLEYVPAGSDLPSSKP